MSFSELYSLKKSYGGNGINHEQQSFVGSLEISPLLNGKGSLLVFKAIAQDGTVFHEETSLLGPGFDEKPCLFMLSNNHPAVTPHQLKEETKSPELHSYIFGFGDVSDRNSFREEIKLALYADGSAEYKYFWGMPDGNFAERSGARMMESLFTNASVKVG